jgi:hypothetical protein
MNPLKIFIIGSIISADNDELTEAEKQAIMARLDMEHLIDADWAYILEPIIDEKNRNNLIKFMESEVIDEIKREEDKLPNDIEPVDMEVLRNEDSI